MVPQIIYEGDPLNTLKIDEYAKRLKEDFKKGIFSKLIEKYLLNNPHKLRLKFEPDPTVMEKEVEQEKNSLSSLAKILSDKEKKQIIVEAELLKKS